MQLFYDSHVHSCHSPDSQQPFWQICETAVEKGLHGIAITDHADMWFWEVFPFKEVGASIADTREAAAVYNDRLRVFCGVEMGIFEDNPEGEEEILAMTGYDVVLASIHSVPYQDWMGFYSQISFAEADAPEEKLAGFMDTYFRKLLHLAQQKDFDILTHLTCPLRYINGKYHRRFSLQPYEAQIDEILRTLISREKSLEVNTSGLGSFYGQLMPDEDIIRRYYALGGRLVTLGSDAHTADRLANGFAETAELLKDIGFPGYYYYDHRQPQLVPWE